MPCSLRLAMNRVLSIRPWKIGTPISMHFSMTSRRSIPASRASSVGVRWIAIGQKPPVRFATWPGKVARPADAINNKSSIRPKHSGRIDGKSARSARRHTRARGVRRPPGRGPRARAARLDRIRDVDPDVLDAEALGQPVAERADAERLGRVVAGGDEVDARLTRE